MALIDLECFLPYRMSRVAATLSRRFRSLYRDRLGLTVPEWRVLATLAQFGTSTATAIGAHSDMHKAKVSRAVSGLNARSWLQREVSREDGRIEKLRLTKAGERAYADVAPAMLELERVLLERVGLEDNQALLTGLKALEQVLERE